jgi:hypothetical protein
LAVLCWRVPPSKSKKTNFTSSLHGRLTLYV